METPMKCNLFQCGAEVTADNMESISLMTFSSTFKLLIISSCVNATQKAGLI